MAIDGGRLFVATGYGTVFALDPKTGRKFWDKNIGVPMRTSPTAAADRVYAVTTDGVLYALSAADGAEMWTYKGLPERASLINNASPAVEGDTVIVPFSSGDVVALKASTGQALWTESLARTRTASSLSAMSDAARPAVDGGTVFAVGHAGRMVATSARTGERLWSITVAGTQQPWVIADTVFVVDTSGQLHAVTRRDGKIQWTARLPAQGLWSGPVLAGGKLWLTSTKGTLVSVEAQTGKVLGTQEIGSPVYIAPVVAGGRMYILADNATLYALN
jgi:outer membrane protein assembly factor BamB